MSAFTEKKTPNLLAEALRAGGPKKSVSSRVSYADGGPMTATDKTAVDEASARQAERSKIHGK